MPHMMVVGLEIGTAVIIVLSYFFILIGMYGDDRKHANIALWLVLILLGITSFAAIRYGGTGSGLAVGLCLLNTIVVFLMRNMTTKPTKRRKIT